MMLPTTAPEFFGLLLDCTIKASVIVVVAWASTVVLRKHSAALRHLVWSAAMVSIILLPLFTLLVSQSRSSVIHSVPTILAAASQQVRATALPSGIIIQASIANSPVLRRVDAGLWIWIFGCLFGLMALMVESIRLSRIADRAESVRDPRWTLEASKVSRRLNLKRPVRFLQNRSESLLVTWGVLRPQVLLPSDADTWSDHRVRVVLGHELAHVRRLDWVVQVVAEIVSAIYWFNPLVWLACNRLRQEGERACDDAVLSLGVEGTEYAAHVLEVARTLKASSRRWSPALAMARHSNLERRFAAMLNTSLDRRAISRKAVFLTTLAALCILLPLSSVRSSAQVQSSRFFGTITDVNGSPVPNAVVVVSNEQAGLRRMTGTLKD